PSMAMPVLNRMIASSICYHSDDGSVLLDRTVGGRTPASMDSKKNNLSVLIQKVTGSNRSIRT
ncbi:hypothetical protein, partial [Alcanivorax sp. HI0044]|uniref:hypothetical protein n=1 Tax=Alcanivorax sp. HI0044 TaxID=1822234 RepID=UPI001E3B027C